jgi:hypothetical protein
MKQKIATLLFLAIITYPAFAQVGIKAQRTIGGNSYDFLSSIYLTKDGGLIHFSSFFLDFKPDFLKLTIMKTKLTPPGNRYVFLGRVKKP